MTRWRTAKLEDVSQVLGGGTPSRAVESYFGGGIAWATPTDITSLDGLYIAQTKETISDEGLRNSSTKLMPPGAVLLTSRATIGFTAVAQVPICTNQGFVSFVCGPDLVPEYLAYWLRTQKSKLIQHAGGTTFKEIARGTVRKFVIPVPPTAEQRRIVDLLSRAEGIVRLRREAEKKAAELIPALFLDMFGDPATNPMEWPVMTIREISALVTSGSTPRGGAGVYVEEGPSFIRSQNVLMNRLDLSDAARITPDIHKQMARTAVKSGDVLLNITGASIGRVAWVETLDGEANVNQHVCIIRLDYTAAEPIYLSVCLSMPYHQQLINTVQAGASRQALNHAQVRSLRVAVPPIELQHRFVERTSGIISIQSQQSAATAKAQAAFDSLLSVAFR
jgi:type I restriction enzyme S subunit